MESVELKKLLEEINGGIKKNKKILDEAIKEELSKGNSVHIDKLKEILKNFEKISEEVHKPENKSIAVCYSGKPEITITYIIDSIIYNNKITLCISGNKVINEILITIILESMRNCKIRNQWINYKPNYNEIYLRDNEKYFNKIVYIGDYFEFERFKTFFKKKVEYNNYGYIKLFMDKSKYKEEYKKIMKYAYIENIYVEIYDDIQECILESKPTDFTIIYVDDFKIVNQLQKELKSKEVLINTFPFDEYKFKVNR